MRPPPSRVATVSGPAGVRTGLPVCTSADLICAGVHVGCRSFSSAAAPATCGEAMLVPSQLAQSWSDGTDERIATPGAETSGFIPSEIVVGPPEENPATTSVFDDAATVIAAGAFAGEPTEPKPKSPKSFPAATTGTTPAAAALLRACTTTSRRGDTSGSPMERLRMFIPSATAWSIALAISGELPSSP